MEKKQIRNLVIIGGFFVAGIIAALIPKGNKLDDKEKYAKDYINIFKAGHIQDLEENTSNISLYHKLGLFNKQLCIRELGQEKIQRIVDNISYDIENMNNLSVQDKNNEMNLRMYDACRDEGGFRSLDAFFTSTKVLKTEEDRNGTKVLLEVFSKQLNKKFKLAVIVNETKDNRLNVYSINYFPELDFFYKK
jgi:hypothetical protein